MKNISIIFMVVAIVLAVATIAVGGSVYDATFNAFRGPFIILGLGLCAIILALGLLISNIQNLQEVIVQRKDKENKGNKEKDE